MKRSVYLTYGGFNDGNGIPVMVNKKVRKIMSDLFLKWTSGVGSAKYIGLFFPPTLALNLLRFLYMSD